MRESPAFPLLVRVLAVLWTVALVVLAVANVPDVLRSGVRSDALWMLAACAVLIVLSTWWIVRSRTTWDGETLRQTWMWNKRVALGDVAQVKLVGIEGLDWLMAPRLVVRTRIPGAVVIHCADRGLLLSFAQAWFERLHR